VILRETKERNGNFIHGHKVWGGGGIRQHKKFADGSEIEFIFNQ
jgi:hypothetical protein